MRSIVFAACLIVALFVLDCAGGTTERVAGVVIGHEYEPAHTSYSTDAKGRVSSHYTPADYTLVVEAGGKTHSVDTNRDGFYLTREGQRIVFTQRRGCMSHAAWMPAYYR